MELKALLKWKLPQSYGGCHWDNYYVFLGRNRDSGPLDNANFDAGYKAVKAVASKESIPGDEDESATVVKVCENHWAVGWVEWIAIHESDEAALKLADEIACALEDYPIVDDELHSRYESEEADSTWKNSYRPKERIEYIRKHRSQFEFHDYADLLGCVRGEHFNGYACELVH